MKHFQKIALSIIFLGCFFSGLAQTVEKKWSVTSIENRTGQSVYPISEEDYFLLKNGTFTYNITAKRNGSKRS